MAKRPYLRYTHRLISGGSPAASAQRAIGTYMRRLSPANFMSKVVGYQAVAGSLQTLDKQLSEARGQLDSLSRQIDRLGLVSSEERFWLERRRMEQSLLGDWQGEERNQLVARLRSMLAQLRPMRSVDFGKARFGSANDGGYVMIDNFVNTDLALSFGVEQNAEWDMALAMRRIPVRQYDHTIDSAPVEHPLITWEKKRIAAVSSSGSATIPEILECSKSLSDGASVILKIDIEHDEWAVFDALDDVHLRRFSQITGEFHGFDYVADRNRLEIMERVVSKLTRTFGVVHVHANNNCDVVNIFGLTVPYVLELSFANRSVYRLEHADETFPTELDAPCDPTKPDIVLGAFRY